MVRFLNDVTGNHLLLYKVVLTSVVFALAGVQVFFAARLWDVSGFPPISPAAAARVHRVSGRVAVTLAAVVALTCLAGPAGPLSPTRVLLHSIFGTLVFVVLTAKFAVLKVLRSGSRALPYIGTALFLGLAGVWATSVADYVTAR
jgi:hypothetical protein